MDDHDDDKAMIATRLNRVPTSFGTDDGQGTDEKEKEPEATQHVWQRQDQLGLVAFAG